MKEFSLSEKLICICLASALFFVPLLFSQSAPLFRQLKLFALEFFLISSSAIWFWNMLARKRLAFMKTPLDRYIFIIFILGSVSILFSPHKYYPLRRMAEIFYYLLAFYLAGNCLRERKFQRIVLWSAAAALLLVSFYGIAQYLGLVKVDWASKPWGMDFDKRIFSTEGNPNWLASYLILMLPLVLAMFLAASSFGETVFFGFASSVAFICLLMTNSWAALLGFLIAVAITRLGLRNDLGEREFLKWRIAAWAIAVIFFVFLIVKGPQALGTTKHLTKRHMHWLAASRMIKDHPIVGVGLDNFQVFSPKYEGDLYREGLFAELWNTEAPFRKTFRAHNEYLDFAAEMGLFSFVVFLAALISFGRYAFRRYREITDKSDRFAYTGLLAGLIAVCIEAFFGFPFHLVTASLFSALFSGMVVALAEKGRKDVVLKMKPSLSKILMILVSASLASCLLFAFRPVVASFYLAQAEALQNNGSFDLAQERYYKAKILQPHHPGISFSQAVTFRKMKEHEKAIEALSDSLREEPYLMQNYLNLALNFTALKDYKNAICSYKKVVELKPRYDYAIRNLAFAHLLADSPTQAAATMEKLILVNDLDPWAHNSLGVIYGKEKDFEKAESHLRRAVEIEPSNMTFVNNLRFLNQKDTERLYDPLLGQFVLSR